MGVFDIFRDNGPPESPPASSPAPDRAAIDAVLSQLEALRRTPIVAEFGGRAPEAPHASWLGRASALPGEGPPEWEGRPLFPVLQINVAELPAVPPALQGTALLALFMELDELPYDQPHGEGWVIREYASVDGLVPLQRAPGADGPRALPIRWVEGQPEGPSWDDAWEMVDLTPVNDDPVASDEYDERFGSSERTKVGGYPAVIQSGMGVADFVFQVGSEEETDWSWSDAGIAYFFKSPEGVWRWECQFY